MAFNEPVWYVDSEKEFNQVVKRVAERQGVPPSISLDSLKINNAVKVILDHVFDMKTLVKIPQQSESNKKSPPPFPVVLKNPPKTPRKKYKKSLKQKRKEQKEQKEDGTL